MKNVMLAGALALFLAGCGSVDGKPLEPSPDGGPVGGSNSLFPNSSANVDPNNVDPNVSPNVTSNNFAPNNGATNVAPNNVMTNGVDRCGPLPAAPEQLIGFTQTVFDGEEVYLESVSSDRLVMQRDGGEQVEFVAVGVDLTNYFFSDSFVVVFDDEQVSEGPTFRSSRISSVESPDAAVEFVSVIQSGDDPIDLFASTSSFGSSVEIGTTLDEFQCIEETQCGDLVRTQSTYSVSVDGQEVEPFQTFEGSTTIYVHQASSLVYEDSCEGVPAVNAGFAVVQAGFL